VDDDVKADRLKRLWDRYCRYIIAIIAAVLSYAVFTNWRGAYQMKTGLSQAEKFERIISNPAVSGEGKALELVDFAKNAKYGYRDVALFNASSLQLEAGRTSDAVETLKELTESAGTQTYRNLAVVKLAGMAEFAGSDGGASYLTGRLKGIGRSGPFHSAAALRLASLYIKQGKDAEAKAVLDAVVNDERTPAGIKSQGLTMLGFIKSRTAE
jgi:hypothetical protein